MWQFATVFTLYVKSTVSKQRSELRKLPVFFVNPLLLPTCQCTDVAFVANLATLGFGSKTLLNSCKLRPIILY